MFDVIDAMSAHSASAPYFAIKHESVLASEEVLVSINALLRNARDPISLPEPSVSNLKEPSASTLANLN